MFSLKIYLINFNLNSPNFNLNIIYFSAIINISCYYHKTSQTVSSTPAKFYSARYISYQPNNNNLTDQIYF